MSKTAGILAYSAPLVAFGTGAILTQMLVRSPAILAALVDEPNERSLHSDSTPRTGGIALLAGVCLSGVIAWSILAPASEWAWVALALVPVAAVSFLDDLGHVAPIYRLAAHLAAVAMLILGGLAGQPLELAPGLVLPSDPWVTSLPILLLVIWMINLYNFMDGMDGFAGGMAVFGFGALALLGWQAEDLSFALLSACVAAAAAGFLTGNFPPARIFLGDLGSAGLGLLAAGFSLVGSHRGLFPLWVPLLAFSPFIVDATWTLIRRLVRGEHIWQAHRSHHYQRLVLAGWSHRRTLLRAYLLMGACAATAVAAPGMTRREQWLLLGAWAVIYALIGYRTRLVERQAGIPAP